MPTWLRVVALAFLLLVALVAAVPLGYAGYQFSRVGSGQATRLGVQVERDGGAPPTDVDVDQTIRVLYTRLVNLGVDSPLLNRSTAPGESVEILLPPMNDPERVKLLLRTSGRLELKPVVGDARMSAAATPEEAAETPGFDPATHEVLPYVERDSESTAAADPSETRYLAVEKRAVVSGQDMRYADAIADQFKSENFEITFSLKPEAADRFGRWTESNIGKDLAIVLDGTIRSAPRIQSKITDRGQITGRFTKETAENLAIALRSGALPGRIVLTSEQLVPSDRWRYKYGAIAGGFGVVVLLALAGAAALVWSLVRRKSAPAR